MATKLNKGKRQNNNFLGGISTIFLKLKNLTRWHCKAADYCAGSLEVDNGGLTGVTGYWHARCIVSRWLSRHLS